MEIYEGDKRNLKLVAAGDLLISRRLSLYNEPRYRAIIDAIRDADVSFANLEVLIHNFEGYPSEHSGGNYMAMPPYVAGELKWAGFNLLSRANNHAGDYSAGGLAATSRHLDEAGLAHAGVGENLARARAPVYLEIQRARVAMLSISSTCPPGSRAGQQRPDLQGRPGANGLRHKAVYRVSSQTISHLRVASEELGWERYKREMVSRGVQAPEDDTRCELLGRVFVAHEKPGIHTTPDPQDTKAMVDGIRAARRQADFVLVSVHSHERDEDLQMPANFMQVFCRACVDAGADAIIGHGPHVLRGIEIYQGRPIFYSLGNFVYQSQTLDFLPADIFERFGLDELRSYPADAFDARYNGDGLRREPRWWQSLLVKCEYEASKLTAVSLIPVTLGRHAHRAQQGRPLLANDEEAMEILSRVQRLSEPFGTRIELTNGLGAVALGG
ncbi:MAG: CapA family protein [Bacillota bacterium]|nr:CapA family protein [Bacillota bacterium]